MGCLHAQWKSRSVRFRSKSIILYVEDLNLVRCHLLVLALFIWNNGYLTAAKVFITYAWTIEHRSPRNLESLFFPSWYCHCRYSGFSIGLGNRLNCVPLPWRAIFRSSIQLSNNTQALSRSLVTLQSPFMGGIWTCLRGR